MALLTACGGSNGPSTPSSSPTPLAPPGLAAGTGLSFVSGENGAPVGGAQVVVAGRNYRADPAGRVTLTEHVTPGALVDVVAPGFFDRQTQLRSDLATR